MWCGRHQFLVWSIYLTAFVTGLKGKVNIRPANVFVDLSNTKQSITLKCDGAHIPQWFHNGERMAMKSRDECSRPMAYEEYACPDRLHIAQATAKHAGEYKCKDASNSNDFAKAHVQTIRSIVNSTYQEAIEGKDVNLTCSNDLYIRQDYIQNYRWYKYGQDWDMSCASVNCTIRNPTLEASGVYSCTILLVGGKRRVTKNVSLSVHALAECKVEPSQLRINRDKRFRINITVRGSPKPTLSLHNPFVASWRLVDEDTGPYTTRRQVEVAGVESWERGPYTLGKAVQITKLTENSHDCRFYLNATKNTKQKHDNCLKTYITDERICKAAKNAYGYSYITSTVKNMTRRCGNSVAISSVFTLDTERPCSEILIFSRLNTTRRDCTPRKILSRARTWLRTNSKSNVRLETSHETGAICEPTYLGTKDACSVLGHCHLKPQQAHPTPS